MILVVEPQCWGVEHSEVNAALLTVIQGAFPNDTILFIAESVHLGMVRENAEAHNNKSIKYQSVCLPVGLANVRRLYLEWNLAKHVYKTAGGLKAERIIFASITSPGLWCIKLLSRKYRTFPVTVIPHIILESIFNRPSLKPWIFPFWFRFSLTIGNMPQLQYLLFGESNKSELCKILPKIKNYVQSINLPYFFMEQQGPIKSLSSIIQFGALGVGRIRKGTDLFFRLATEVHQKTRKEDSEFILIGTLEGQVLRKLANAEVILPSPDKPLSRQEYETYVNKIDYAIFCQNPKSYRLTVCATLYDALSYLKPIIALKTPFFEYYFSKMGDIGYLCDDYEEMLSLIIGLIKSRPRKRYMEQCNNILRGRDFFRIANLSIKMKDIFE